MGRVSACMASGLMFFLVDVTEWLRLQWISGDHLSSLPLLKQTYLEPAVQNCVQMTFEHLQGWRPHNLSGQPGCDSAWLPS